MAMTVWISLWTIMLWLSDIVSLGYAMAMVVAVWVGCWAMVLKLSVLSLSESMVVAVWVRLWAVMLWFAQHVSIV
jgi:hypothetical protein